MSARSRAGRLGWVGVVGVGYVVIAVVTSELAKPATSPRAVTAWRLAAWLLSLVAFLVHVVRDRLRPASTSTSTARHAAAAVALGAFLLAAIGPVRTHWGAPNFWRTVVLSIVAWPIITGLPAFVAAFVIGSIIGRARAKSAAGRSFEGSTN